MTPASAVLGVLLALGAQGAAPAFEEVARKAAEARDKDQLDDAIRWYREGTRMRPRWDEGLWYLATLLYEKDRFAEARDAFRQFLVLKPETGPAWALLGMCEFRLKEYEAALKSLQRGTDLGYGTNTAVQRAAWFHLSMLLVRAGQFELAVHPLTFLARSEPESPALVEVAGLMLVRAPKLPAEITDGRARAGDAGRPRRLRVPLAQRGGGEAAVQGRCSSASRGRRTSTTPTRSSSSAATPTPPWPSCARRSRSSRRASSLTWTWPSS